MAAEYALRLLAEMGVDVYVLRDAAAGQSGTAENPAPMASAPVPAATTAPDADVVLAVDPGDRAAARLSAAVARVLRTMGLAVAPPGAPDADSLAKARGLVALGDAVARRAGALLTAQRHRDIAWVVSAEPAELVESPVAKRALWAELKHLRRTLGAATATPARRDSGKIGRSSA